MLPMVGVPETIGKGLRPYRDLCGRAAGFAHVSRYVTGLIVSPNKTRQGIYAGQVWEGEKPSRRAMHEAVFAAGWDAEGLLPRQRAVIAPEQRERGREVSSLDWTLVPQERGPQIDGTAKSYDYGERRMARFQPGVTAVVATRQLIDGIDVQIQEPSVCQEEESYLQATVQANYAQMEQARERLVALLHHLEHRLAYQKRTEIVGEMVAQREEEERFPPADSAFDKGVLTLELTRLSERKGNHGVSELESARHILGAEQWRRIEEGARELHREHPESFRRVQGHCRKGEPKLLWAVTQTVRLQRYGRNRIVMGHEQAELTDSPRFLVTAARHGERGRSIETWSLRWAAAVCHEFSKQETGLAAAQGRHAEAVNRHLRLSCLAQSLRQRAPAVAAKSEQCAFAEGQITFGQRCRAIGREVFHALLSVAKRLFAGGYSCEQVAEALRPA